MSFGFREDSVFTSQPLLLDIRQRRFLVGIRFAVEAIELSRVRLWDAMERWHAEGSVRGGTITVGGLFTDVWSIVDNARRFQRLLWKLPIEGETEFASEFVRRWPSLKTVRDSVQHIDQDFSKANMLDNYVYGQLCWVDSRFRLRESKVFAYFVPAGPQSNRQLQPSSFPAEIVVDSGTSLGPVILQAGGVSLSITELLRDIHATVQILEDRVGAAIEIILANERNEERLAKLKAQAKISSGFRMEFTTNASPDHLFD